MPDDCFRPSAGVVGSDTPKEEAAAKVEVPGAGGGASAPTPSSVLPPPRSRPRLGTLGILSLLTDPLLVKQAPAGDAAWDSDLQRELADMAKALEPKKGVGLDRVVEQLSPSRSHGLRRNAFSEGPWIVEDAERFVQRPTGRHGRTRAENDAVRKARKAAKKARKRGRR